VFGPNTLKVRQEASALGLLLNQFRSPIVLILIAAVVSAVLQDWANAVIIFLIVLGSALLSFYQESSATSAAATAIQRPARIIAASRSPRVLARPASWPVAPPE